MDEIRKYTAELSRALRESEAYTAFREASTRVKEKPGLKQKIDEFRKKNYLLQDSKDTYDLFEDMAELEKEYEELRKDPLVRDYLFTELQMCRIIQRCANEILTSVDLEIENFADVIEI